MNGGRSTIYALSSAAGRAAIAVVRVSGPAAGAALEALAGAPLPQPRVAKRVALRRADGEPLDDALALWFPAPRSETGEAVVEFHIHGGRAVIAGLLEALGTLPGLRPAEPGEFTKRAFINGKIDLTAAEGLGDLIDADTEAQKRQALRQLEGGLGTLYEGWRARLMRVLAHLEAEIDFADEDLPADVGAAARHELETLRGDIARHLDDARRGEVLRDGLSVAIVGAPNVGKSSLLNALLRREAAIVSSIAGTTRDIVEARLDLGGYPILLADTAGLREIDARAGGDPIEAEGIKRALARAEQADLRLGVFDARTGPDAALKAWLGPATIPIANKADLTPDPSGKVGSAGELRVSAATGYGLDALRDRLEAEAQARMNTGSAPVITRARHRAALRECVEHLDRARGGTASELVAEDTRLAARALGRITGRVDVEDLLDIIFRDFCIGK
ncbi:MAG: tRNA uridine-5-carboxymethylaminomethyl(34) synthesis GTPase MnmE [Rhodospirillaceae bacterium]|nr:tRNA uridine-5-carboxymethylaminomethyl(34) synthesis GTPase MnmE [Rhodospirillaceae bacterium]